MPQVDFYILPEAAPAQRALFACRLIEKIYKLGHRIYVHHQHREQAEIFDDMLWRVQPTSFLPHELGAANTRRAVQIGWHGAADTDHLAAELLATDSLSTGLLVAGAGTENNAGGNVLINLADAVPEFFNSFQRISEIVVQTPEVLAATRNAWRYYQQQGCALERHDLRAGQA
ncbi:MAG TPA: DNA polymerase III subunit chi [Spongiibacteraceae bacterium]|nr:DNA polymerase III subunit chi [Spongiibacteraceae bacterium]